SAAERGETVFNTTGRCASCHIPALAFSDANLGVLHDPAETGTDPVRATRLKNHQYRTTPLRALWQHPPYFHDGSAATLSDVVAHYDRVLGLGLSPQQQADLVEYLKSLWLLSALRCGHESAVEQQVVDDLQRAGDEERQADQRGSGKHPPGEHGSD